MEDFRFFLNRTLANRFDLEDNLSGGPHQGFEYARSLLVFDLNEFLGYEDGHFGPQCVICLSGHEEVTRVEVYAKRQGYLIEEDSLVLFFICTAIQFVLLRGLL